MDEKEEEIMYTTVAKAIIAGLELMVGARRVALQELHTEEATSQTIIVRTRTVTVDKVKARTVLKRKKTQAAPTRAKKGVG